MTLSLEQRAEALERALCDVTEPEQVTPAILAALRAVVEACEAICEKRYGCVNPGHTLEYKSAYQGSCYDIKQQIRREVGT